MKSALVIAGIALAAYVGYRYLVANGTVASAGENRIRKVAIQTPNAYQVVR